MSFKNISFAIQMYIIFIYRKQYKLEIWKTIFWNEFCIFYYNVNQDIVFVLLEFWKIQLELRFIMKLL